MQNSVAEVGFPIVCKNILSIAVHNDGLNLLHYLAEHNKFSFMLSTPFILRNKSDMSRPAALYSLSEYTWI